jgi:hypothetical protein
MNIMEKKAGFDEWNGDNMDLFWIGCLPLFEGLVKFVQHGYCHRDVKLENILYHPVTGKLVLIDFGFMKDFNHYEKFLGLDQPDKDQVHFPLDFMIYTEWKYDRKLSMYSETKLSKMFRERVYPQGEFGEFMKGWFNSSVRDFAKSKNLTFEQFKRKSIETTDLYGLAVALLTLCTFLPDEEGKIQYNDLRWFLMMCINPNLDKRYTAEMAVREFKELIAYTGGREAGTESAEDFRKYQWMRDVKKGGRPCKKKKIKTSKKRKTLRRTRRQQK